MRRVPWRGLLLGVIAAVTITPPLAQAAPARWSITPPAGWSDVTAELAADPAAPPEARPRADAGTEVRFYRDAGGDDWLQVTYMTKAFDQDGTVFDVEAGLRRSLDRHGTVTRARRRIEPDALVLDFTVVGDDHATYGRTILGSDAPRRMVSVAATCIAAEAVCQPALDSLQLDRTGFRPVPAPSSAAPGPAVAPPAPGPAVAPPAPVPARRTRGDVIATYVEVGLGAVVILLAIALLVRRRRRRG
ncbi:MAG: hypothetical protein R3B06_06730 [Kofleriaceae bacterium]